MAEQLELSDFSREQLEEIIRRAERRESLSGRQDVMKATAAVVRKASERLETEIAEASQRAPVLKSVDACFVLDCTLSMKKQIQAAKDKIGEIKNEIIRGLGHGGNIRFSVVGYRDYSDEKQFEILPFCGDVKDVEAFVSQLEATGGGDTCENVIGALGQALKLDWKARTRIMYLIGDAPPHGTRFQGPAIAENFLYFDHLPHDTHQWQTTDEIMANSVHLKLNLVMLEYPMGDFYLIQKTFEVFQELRQTSSSPGLQTLLLRPDNTPEDFVRCIMESTKETISKTLTQLLSGKPGTRVGSAESSSSLEVKANCSWKDWQTWPLQQVLVTAVSAITLNSDATPTRVIQRFRIRSEPFASGSMRYAFPVTSDDGTLHFVLKVHKDTSYATAAVALTDAKTQSYAKVFAEEFSRRCRQTKVQFLDVWAVELPRWKIAKFATLEPFVEGNFQKYTSNNGFSSPEAALAETFCHFSYCHSGGQMMVTDLQGFGSTVFTDPQIHCTNKNFFSRGNLGKDGMDQFFLGHCCNDLCRDLQLKESPLQCCFEWETDSTISGMSGERSSRSKLSSFGPLVCEYCNKSVPVQDQEYIQLMDECQAIMCSSCKEKVKENMASTRCLSCQQPFKYSMFAMGLKGSYVPAICRSCEQGEVWHCIE